MNGSAGAESGMVILADREGCIGAAMCIAAAPTVFDLDEDGKVRLLKAVAGAADLEAVEEAVELCPVRALELRSPS